jgi:HEPN domain-containing protein
MPPKGGAEGTPEEWLRRAKGNLALAKQRKPRDAYWEDLCFEAEQAVEKALKAVLRSRGIDFPKTHDIGELLALLERSGQKIPQDFWKADSLTTYAVETRYPGPAEPVTRSEYREAVALAGKVVKWAESVVLPERRK